MFEDAEDDEDLQTEDFDELQPWDLIPVPEGAITFPEHLPQTSPIFRHIFLGGCPLPSLKEVIASFRGGTPLEESVIHAYSKNKKSSSATDAMG